MVNVLPKDTLLLHIGPPKTGTTSIQAALARRRRGLLRHGVEFPGRGRRNRQAVWSLGLPGYVDQPPPISAWQQLCQQVAASTASRVVLSDEVYAHADATLARRIVADLQGKYQPQVLLFARRLDQLLPSQWQERVKHGVLSSFDQWVHRLVSSDGTPDWEHDKVWAVHNVVALVRRWGEIVGFDNVTLVVADPTDRQQIFRVFEQLLGLPTGWLTPPRADPAAPGTNQAMSWDRVELLRAIVAATQALDWSQHQRRQAAFAMLRKLREADLAFDPARTKPALPEWAHSMLQELSAQRVEQLRELPIQIVGDVEQLRVPPARKPAAAAPTEVPIRVAATAVVGLLEALATDSKPSAPDLE